MEYYEGASYKINIEGYDSTLILDGYTRTLKATVIDQNDNIILRDASLEARGFRSEDCPVFTY
jgi:hypothetical protein